MKLTALRMLLVVAIGAGTALIGSSAAVATSTALCSEPSVALACPATKLTTTIHAFAEPEFISKIGFNVFCGESLLAASVLALGSPQIMHLTALTFTSCFDSGGGKCTVSTKLLALFNLLKEKANVATAWSTGGPVIEIDCAGFFSDCAYGGTPTFEVLSASPPTPALLEGFFTLSRNALHSKGVMCPETVVWSALYGSLTASNFWVRG